MKTWRTERDKRTLFDAVAHTKQFLAENSNYEVRIYVGCDSQNLRKSQHTGYVTVIACHVGTIDEHGGFAGRGIHVIFKSEKYKKIHDNFSRLWKEVEKSLEVAEMLRKSGILVYRVDLDFNEDAAHDSNRMVAGAEGLFTGLGYRVASKPKWKITEEDRENGMKESTTEDQVIASRAADSLIHSISWKRIPIST